MPTPEAPFWLPAVVLAVGVFAAVAVTFDRPGLGLVAAGVVGGLAAFVSLLVRPGVPEGDRAPIPDGSAGPVPVGSPGPAPGAPRPAPPLPEEPQGHTEPEAPEDTEGTRDAPATGEHEGTEAAEEAETTGDTDTPDDRSRAWAAVYGVASALLLSTALFLDAGWVLLWTLPASFLLASLAFATRNPAARQNPAGLLAGATAVVRNTAAAPRFLARPVRRVSSRTNAVPVLATAGITAALLLAFGTLLVLADPVFREFAVRPFRSLTVDGGSVGSLFSALVAMAATTGAVLAARRRLPGPRPARDPKPAPTTAPAHSTAPAWSWAVPLGAVVLLFTAFLTVQAVTLFGGDAYVQRVAGVTYAEYARQGFFQLVVVSALVMGVVGASVRLVPKRPGRGRTLRNALLGALCLLTMVILASAMVRLQLYIDTFGLTRMRATAEAWIVLSAVVFALVVAVGALNTLGRRAGWLPRATVAATAAALLAFAAGNPDARIAESHHDLDLAEIDTGYLRGLSADALPALVELEGDDRACAVQILQSRVEEPDDVWSWNLSRHQAHTLLQEEGPFEVGDGYGDPTDVGPGDAEREDGGRGSAPDARTTCAEPRMDGEPY
ncbi:DUF4173 domain-containing protein [Nocardiopsis sp. HNM0947]|uniref:DUF4173 domain-containing protein n=2 Tax=Nocardiopsis coralli TaxID=2772213 RepID=A0ABR9PDL7_9ACTN|nr:DUF4173 domain-containing protein [Nocardiopsis coralli]